MIYHDYMPVSFIIVALWAQSMHERSLPNLSLFCCCACRCHGIPQEGRFVTLLELCSFQRLHCLVCRGCHRAGTVCFTRETYCTSMRPPKASVFSLDVVVHDVWHEAGCVAGSLAGDNLAIACRFLDYPLIFIRPRSKKRENQTIKFNNGKSCALSEEKACLKDSLQQVRPDCSSRRASKLALRH